MERPRSRALTWIFHEKSRLEGRADLSLTLTAIQLDAKLRHDLRSYAYRESL